MIRTAVIMVIDKIVIQVNTITYFAKINADRIFEEVFHNATISGNGTSNQEKAENRRNQTIENNINNIMYFSETFVPVLH